MHFAIALVMLGQVHVGQCESDDRVLATPRAYPTNVVDSVNRPGFNGRLYVRRPVIGGMEGPYTRACGDSEDYGAFGHEDAVVWARVNHQPIALDPWTPLPSGLRGQEESRQVWLKQRGYVGGVRTHVNDAYLYAKETEVASAPQPRATITVPSNWRRTPTLQVKGYDVRPVVSMSELASVEPAIDLRPVMRMNDEAEETVAKAE